MKEEKRDPCFLITGAAGFIGFHLAKCLLETDRLVVGFDNLNDYYDPILKQARIRQLKQFKDFVFVCGNLEDAVSVNDLFERFKPTCVINLAAQAGVRYSIENPQPYVDSNIVGFFNILEACRHHPVEHLIYASSSSVYGNQKKIPFSIEDDVSYPISLYAATKKSNELMAYAYSYLYNIPSTGLRFFTVYGPWGRPDMAYFSFTKKLINGDPIKVFNYGDMKRDFTYIDDVIQGICNLISSPPQIKPPHRLYNIGNNHPEDLMFFIKTLEACLICEGLISKPADIEFLPMQPGDVYQTYADVDALVRDFDFRPSTSIEKGLAAFASWYREYYTDASEE